MANIIRQCKTCTLLETRVQSLGTATKDMPTVTSNLLQKYGKKWTYSLGINDLYFDGMVPGLVSANIRPSGQLFNISAGDGSESAYQRVRTKQYQYATIPEPINLQGWQLVDEINRAINKDSQAVSKFLYTLSCLVTSITTAARKTCSTQKMATAPVTQKSGVSRGAACCALPLRRCLLRPAVEALLAAPCR